MLISSLWQCLWMYWWAVFLNLFLCLICNFSFFDHICMINCQLCYYQFIRLGMASLMLQVLTLTAESLPCSSERRFVAYTSAKKRNLWCVKDLWFIQKSMYKMRVLIGLAVLCSCADHGPWLNNQMNDNDFVQ